MGIGKEWSGYRSFSYLEPRVDYRPCELSSELGRVPAHPVPLDAAQKARVRELAERLVFVSMHEHMGVFPEDISETPEYAPHGRMATAFRGLAASWWDRRGVRAVRGSVSKPGES